MKLEANVNNKYTYVCNQIMTRTYTLKRRAEQQAQTRQRIVEAAVELHSSIGPARTTISMIADRAGVQRHTFYAHFPDERSIFAACSGLVEERDPMPDAGPWAAIEDWRERLRVGLGAIYGWYERNAELLFNVLRDVEVHALARETAQTRFGPFVARYHKILGEKLNAKQQPMLNLALSYFTWRTLVREGGLKSDAAAAAMVQAIDCADNA
jgi:AcrR family transcriptional regulator